MDKTPQKDYFEYQNGEIIYKDTNQHTSSKFSTELYLKSFISFFTTHFKKIIYILLAISICSCVIFIFSTTNSFSWNSTSSSATKLDVSALELLEEIETLEFSVTQDYITSKTSSLYAKKTITDCLNKKQLLSSQSNLSEETLMFITNSIHHSSSLLKAFEEHNFVEIETLHNKYYKKS